MSDKIPRKISSTFNHSFNIKTFGLYSITVTAKGKLRVEIDGEKLREIPPKDKPQYNTIPTSWDNKQLKGKDKTVIFVLRLNEGEHNIKFVCTEEVNINHFSVEKIVDPKSISFELEKKASDADKRPFITLALINLPLKSLETEASTDWHWFDGDDIKLIIDTAIQKNSHSTLHKNWLWSASPLQKFTGPKKEKKTIGQSLPSGIHYIEFWTDKTPTIHSVNLDLGDITLKRIPTVNDPKWTGDFSEDTDQMILARALFGEIRDTSFPDLARVAIGWSIKNRISDRRWADTYWEVITQDYQYSAFNSNDSNRKYVEDPLHSGEDIDEKAWKNVYEIAGKVISGEVKDPTHGANHYHDNSIEPPSYLSPEALVLSVKNASGKRIVHFYRL